MEELDMILPDDYEEEDTTEPVTEVEAEETETEDTTEVEEETEHPESEETEPEQTEEHPETVDNSFELPFKFNHEEGKLTDKSEAQRLVQLGLLYQSKEQEFNTLRESKGQLDKMVQIAELHGMDVDTLYDSLYNQYIENQADATGYTPEQIRKEMELSAKEKAITSKEQTEQETNARNEMYARFRDTYPGVDAKQIKPETWTAVNAGTDLTTAYTMQLNKELQEQIKIKTQNVKNKSTSPAVGTTKTGTADSTKDDDFLDGFWGK